MDMYPLMEAKGKSGLNSKIEVNVIDMDLFVKRNELQPISNPVMFKRNNQPTPDGLLSNEIFGITMYDRSNTCAYIELYEPFLNPLVYSVWSKLDKKIIECVHGTKKFRLNEKGELVEDEHGKCGVKFLKNIFKDINIARTASTKRDLNVDFIEKCKNLPGTFLTKWPVIPAYYRDVDTSKGGRVSIGEINELYRNLLITTRSLKDIGDYGLDMSDAIRGRIQETIMKIFDWYGMGTTINGTSTGSNIPGKKGIIRRAVLSKTTDYATRLVMSAPDLKCEKGKDLRVTLEYSGLPMSSAISNFMPFIIFYVKRWFENAFSGNNYVPFYSDNRANEERKHVKDYQVQFSEERIKKEIKRFLAGYSNRLIPINVEFTDGTKSDLMFRGYQCTEEEFKSNVGLSTIMDRPFTWCDIFFIAAVEVTRDKHITFTRYPIDTIYNQFATKVRINSTNETEGMLVDEKFYPDYPKFTKDDIGTNTSNMFIDTINISNLYLPAIGGDYDGDTGTVKGVFTVEANEEIEKMMKSNFNLIDTGGHGLRTASQECIQSMYALTICMPDDRKRLTKPTF